MKGKSSIEGSSLKNRVIGSATTCIISHEPREQQATVSNAG